MSRRRYKARFRVVVLVIMGLMVTAMPAMAGPPASDGTVTVTIVSTNDFHGALIGRVHSWSHGDVVGSADYLTGYINIVRQENPGGVLWLDAGDAMQGTLISNYFFGASTIEVFNAAGVDAMAVGNHEFDWGQEVLQNRYDQADFPFLGTNVFFAKQHGNPNRGHGGRPHWVKPYKVLEANGIEVGVIGVANPETPSITNPVNVSNLVFLDPVEQVEEVLPEVERDGATMVVVLAHIGGYWPDFEEGIKDLACGLDPDRVDLIVSGHTHSRIDDVICGIPVVQAYSSGTAFARVDFTVDEGSGEVVSYEMNYSPTSTYQTYYGNPARYQRWDTGEWVQVVPDPVITALVDEFNAEIDAIKNEVVGEATTAVTRNYRYESEMGDWVTDIMAAYDPSIDFAFTNSGGLRADIDAGEVTFGEIFEALPFDNTLVVVELDGAEVRQVLEEGITGDHGLIQVSGLQFTFDYDEPVGSRIMGDVIDLATGLPLDPGTTYYVAVNDFMAAGGDDYLTLASNPQTNSYELVRDLVVDWVRANSPFTPPDPAIEQRITALGTPPS
ncbi:MAG: 5'-nucleotidase C-terminal domain-containing protein [Anaerolineales bacterium]